MLAGGMESASNAPYILKTARWGFRMGEQRAQDVLHADGFLCPISGKLMLESMAEIVSYSITALDADHFPIAPVTSMKNALSAAGMSLDDMEIVELNEAFAAQVIACRRLLPFDMEKLNVCGGAIALGHPIGATGAKILTTLLYSLKREKKELGMASACIGGGQGVAMIVRML